MGEEGKRVGRYLNARTIAEMTDYPADAFQAVAACHELICGLESSPHMFPGDPAKPRDITSHERLLNKFPLSVPSCMSAIQPFLRDWGITMMFTVDVMDCTRVFATVHLEGIWECSCVCHEDRMTMHIMACCQGECKACGKGFHSGLKEHERWCPGQKCMENMPVITTTTGVTIGKIPDAMLRTEFTGES